MQLPASKPSQHNDLQAMCKLVEDIEAVHAQLAKTLIESQKITGREAVPEEESSRDAKIQASTSTPKSKSVDNTVTTHTQESETVEGKAKPKIISDKRVNLQLNRFKTQQKTQAPTPIRKIPDRNSWQTRTVPLHSEEVIEKLSREILRQTNSLDKTGSAFISLKRSDESSTQHKASPSKEANLTNNTSSEHEKNSRLTRENVQEVNYIFLFLCTFTEIINTLCIYIYTYFLGNKRKLHSYISWYSQSIAYPWVCDNDKRKTKTSYHLIKCTILVKFLYNNLV